MSVCMASSLSMIFTVFPINLPSGDIPARLNQKKWTLLSYNICQFLDQTHEYAENKNPGIEYILEKDADIVVLAEGRWLCPLKGNYITQELIDKLHARYPYFFIGEDISFFSKFPADTVSLNEFPKQLYGRSSAESKVGALQVDIHGNKTTILGLHLKSLGLTRNDKDIYEDLTRGEGLTSKYEISEIKNDVLRKISFANRERAKQVKGLLREIEILNSDNLIVCGDFNDTPGCFALHQLESIGMREVYPLVGSGYMSTYNKDRLFFQIDHVLFKGSFRPWHLERDNIKSSDHFPLFVTFI